MERKLFKKSVFKPCFSHKPLYGGKMGREGEGRYVLLNVGNHGNRTITVVL